MNRLTKSILNIVLLVGISISVTAQNRTSSAEISGIVYESATGKPIATAQVTIPGVASTITSDNGEFKITKSYSGATLIVTAPGYATRQVSVIPGKKVNIWMMDESFKGNYENILLPFDISNARQSAYALSTHENREDFKLAATSLESVLQGSVNGLNTVLRSGAPASGANMFLNGFNSLNSNTQPLIIVDGIPFNNETIYSLIGGNAVSPLSDIDVKDIDYVTVIKDGSSTYGSKAANGVILIQTLRAKGVATRIDFHSYAGLNMEPNTSYQMMDAWQYKTYLTDMLSSKGLTSNEIQALPYINSQVPVVEDWGVSGNAAYYRYNQSTDWQSEVYHPSINQNYHLNVTGGNENALYAISFGYLGHNGQVDNTNYERYSTRVNAKITMTEWFKLIANMSFVYSSRDVSFEGENRNFNPVYAAQVKAPFMSPYVYNVLGEKTPNLENFDLFNISNPLAITQNGMAKNSRFRFFGIMNGELTFSEYLNVNLLFGLTTDQTTERMFMPNAGIYHTTLPSATIWNESQQLRNHLMQTNSEARLNYKRVFDHIHSVKAHLGFRFQTNKSELDWGKAYNTSSDEMKTLGDGLNELAKMGGSLGSWNSVSDYLNAEYGFMDRYFLSVNASLDGSSRFGKEASGIKLFNNVFGFFPSVNAAWLINSEEFMSDIQAVDLLKLRVGYSITGNDEIGNYSARQYYLPQPLLGAFGLVRGNIPNRKLKWETNKKMIFGVDASFLQEKLNVSLDVFSSTTEDLIQINQIDAYTGLGTSISNDGALRNQGWDLNLNGRILDRTDLKWDIGVQVSAYKNKLIELTKTEMFTEISGGVIRTKVGEPIAQFFGYETNGIFTTAADAADADLKMVQPDGTAIPFSAGDVIFSDLDHNHIINEIDRKVIGDPNPHFIGSITNSIQWNRFKLNALFTYSIGGQVFNALRSNLESVSTTDNQTIAAIYRWKTDGQETNMPKAIWGDPKGNARFSDRWIEDGSYLRMKSVTLAYDLNIRPGQINSIQLYVTGNNLLTFSRYLGSDPEFSISQSPLYQGIDNGVSAQPRTILFGVRIGL